MIRVVYRWQVNAEAATEFERRWHEGTVEIRRLRPGALGSLLLRSRGDPEQYVGVARWTTEDDLAAFWENAGTRNVGDAELQSVEVFDELDDLTIG